LPFYFLPHSAAPPCHDIKSAHKQPPRFTSLRHFLPSLEYPDKVRRLSHEPVPLLVGPASRG
ncbi:polyphosphate kinase 2, partial [Pseudomonas aeruginosa]